MQNSAKHTSAATLTPPTSNRLASVCRLAWLSWANYLPRRCFPWRKVECRRRLWTHSLEREHRLRVHRLSSQLQHPNDLLWEFALQSDRHARQTPPAQCLVRPMHLRNHRSQLIHCRRTARRRQLAQRRRARSQARQKVPMRSDSARCSGKVVAVAAVMPAAPWQY